MSFYSDIARYPVLKMVYYQKDLFTKMTPVGDMVRIQ